MSSGLLYALIGGALGVLVDECYKRLFPRLWKKTMNALRALRRKMKRPVSNNVREADFSFEEPRYQPRPIDPENPPKVMFYRPKRPNSMAFCTNCGDAIERGDKVLVFPATEDSHPEIICERCVKKS